MLELIKKVANYTKAERIKRLIEIALTPSNISVSASDQIEFMMIQHIRETNGEIEEVKRARELTDQLED